ncbi:MAG: hypothetical protein J6039_00145 [Alphaproteobacteria bacterium]|nr:hypothetical protein [Alphaproteobacteria bacterium]
MKNNQSGRSMLEMLGVVAIIGLLSIGGLSGYGKMLAQHKIDVTMEQIGVISSKLSAVGSRTSSYGGLSNESAIKLGAVPSEAIISSSGTLENVFGGSITIGPSNLIKDSTDNQAYAIKYFGLPAEACVAIATNDWSNSKNSALLGISAGTTDGSSSIYQDCNGSATNTLSVACPGGTNGMPMDLDKATNACSCTANGCVVVFKYY